MVKGAWVYTLKGDRHFEYEFAGKHIRKAPLTVPGRLLDIGPGERAKLAKYAISQGWNVVAYDLMPCEFKHRRFLFFNKDFIESGITPFYDIVLCVSSIEHFGIPGRYGVKKLDPDADLKAMKKIRDLLPIYGEVILTLPLGVDSVLAPYHRVYGDRFWKLTEDFQIVESAAYHKIGGVDEYVKTTVKEAMGTVPTLEPAHYYALGCFVLRKR